MPSSLRQDALFQQHPDRRHRTRLRSGRRLPCAGQRGVGLIEILVALIVLAIGLLGVAALQTSSLRNNQSSFDRANAVVLVNDIVERMRANASVAKSDGYSLAFSSSSSNSCPLPTGSSRADVDLSEWRTTIIDTLGDSACGAVSCTDGLCTITIRYDDSRALEGAAAQTLVSTVLM
ncbi:type IV pilus modification protein PilV [Pokkaliibacter plantistimulans]|uniref:type IV pilus modification protein PilV n=1 Tax=Pokkaliibacter plantistimulans TaxID=1635171 RepID=UPI002680629A|nr:type IV pilus modification protein PilV [Pokkaliibacter plantistimulans]